MYSLMVPEENMKYEKPSIETEIERLISEYGNDVLRVSYIYLKDRHRAEDAFQEVFLKVYKKYESFNGMSSEKTWLISITINVCKDFLRSSWIKRVLPFGNVKAEGAQMDMDDRMAQFDDKMILLNEVMSLSPAHREVIMLHYYQGYDTVELGKILGITESTVRSRLFRARKILRKRIDGRIEYND